MRHVLAQGLGWAILATAGLILILSPRTPALVESPDRCPDTWNRERVWAAEHDGGFQCVAEVFDPEEREYHIIPVGEVTMPPRWMGWALLGIAGIGFLTSATWGRLLARWRTWKRSSS